MRASFNPDDAIVRLAHGEIGGTPTDAWRLIDRAWPSLTRFVQQRLRAKGAPRESVSDCAQNVFRRVWKYRRSYRGATESEWWGWLRMITDNEMRRILVAEGRQPTPQSDFERPGEDEASDGFGDAPPDASFVNPTLDSVLGDETALEIHDCLSRLPAQHRKVVELIYLRGELTERAVAEVIECSASYVHKLKSQAIERLRRCMEKKGID